MRVERYRAEIASDLQAACDYYNLKRAGLGDEFLDEFWSAVDMIMERPLSFAAGSMGMRPCRIRRFSYVIHYRVTDQEVLIVAVMSGSRDVSAWFDRI